MGEGFRRRPISEDESEVRLMQAFMKDLLAASGAAAWEITNTVTEGWEFYFIHHELDQNRVKKVEHTNVKVYTKSEDGKFLGSAAAEIHPTCSEEEARKVIERLLFESTLVKNPVYELNYPVDEKIETVEELNPAQIAKDFIKTMSKIPETDTEDINSYEIFVNCETKHFMNSNGIDVVSAAPSSMIEVVVNARKDGHEIELYRNYKSGSCDGDYLAKELAATLKFGRDRLIAEKTPNLGTCDALFTTEAASGIYDYFLDRMAAGMVYRKMSDFEIDKPVIADAKGDMVTIRAVTELPNSSKNAAYDSEGAKIVPMTIIDKGIAKHYWGSRQFSQYLCLKDSFIVGNIEVEGGSSKAEELCNGSYIELVEFSDFQVDSMTGDIAGEIRLAYLHEADGSVKIVTGGSVSGNMRKLAKSMKFSKERTQYNSCLIPSVTRLFGVSITGAQ